MDEENLINDFLIDFIHYILYQNKVYSTQFFVPIKKYGISIYKCKHPEILKYINDCFVTIEYLNGLRKLKRLSLILLNEESNPVDIYNIDILSLNSIFISDPLLIKYEKTIRSFFLKFLLSGCSSNFNQCSSFSLKLFTSESASELLNEQSFSEVFPWIEVEKFEKKYDFSIKHIRNVDTDYFNIKTSVEKILLK